MSRPYNVYYDNRTGRVVIHKNTSPPRSRSPPKDFDKKIEELYKFSNIDSPNKVSIEKPNDINTININKILNESELNIKEEDKIKKKEISFNDDYKKFLEEKDILKKKENLEEKQKVKIDTNNNENNKIEDKPNNENNNIADKQNNVKSLIYGIKKTILSDFNHLNQSSNTNDFKIGLNKNITENNKIFDCFYLFPNIAEINTKNETNIINEKKVDFFYNNNNNNDIQFFPIDFIPCGNNIPLLNYNKYYKKLIIKNIFWNIFQSINSSHYKLNEILCIVPNKDDFIYRNIHLQVNFELHSQIISKDLPYKNKNNNGNQITPANTCLYKIASLPISNLSGSNFHFLEIDLNPNFNIECALLCIKISVPLSQMVILEGYNIYNCLSYGHIPFSQFILNFDYEIY